MNLLKKISLSTLLVISCQMMAHSAIDVYEFDSTRQEAQYRALIEEFRCPKCQNQNLAGSDAPIAQDLKQKTYEMVRDGRTDAEIRDYMFERYGDFISYKPPMRPSTWILWFFPPVLLVILLFVWFVKNRHKTKQSFVEENNIQPLTVDEQQRLNQLLNQNEKSQG